MPETLAERIAEKYVTKDRLGKDFVVCFNGHVVWRGKDENAADAVISVCFKPDVEQLLQDFAREVAEQIRAEKVPAIASPSIVNVPAGAYWDGFSRGLIAAAKIVERAGGEG